MEEGLHGGADLPSRIRSTGGRYASYWNAYLLTIETIHIVCFTEIFNKYQHKCTRCYLNSIVICTYTNHNANTYELHVISG